jgi:hypothetical protein
LGQRSRKRGRREKPVGAAARPVPDTPAMSRSEARNAQARAALRPLAPGERPWPVTVGAIVAALLGAGNLIAYLAGVKTKLGGKPPGLGAIVLFAGIMFVCAAGMWRLRYWAVLGFQTLLAIGLLGFSLALIKATPLGILICLAVLVPGGYLFYKLVRVLGRLQMPAPPGRRS